MNKENSKDTAIQIRNLTKTYRLYNRPIDRIKETFLPGVKPYHQPFQALVDVTLDIKKGETVGIVGRNGSGKSTLLQLVCGIIQPTIGTVNVNGRISALLELGAGFNPEFTGLQNVYLNGSILGLQKTEIDDKLEAILDFADIGEFIDQPVKSYSSGMFVRLAFAVAISVEPEILIVDEALSVGDEAFQRKCFAHINSIQERGGTILFVTHSASTVVELCSRAFLFDQGELLLAGAPKQIVSRYQKMIYAPEDRLESLKNEYRKLPDRFHLLRAEKADKKDTADDVLNEGSVEKNVIPDLSTAFEGDFDPNMLPVSTINYEKKGATITDPCIRTSAGRQVNILTAGETYHFCYQAQFDGYVKNIKFGMLIKTLKGIEISGCSASLEGHDIENIDVGDVVDVKFPFRCSLNPGVYFLNAGILGTVEGVEEHLDRQLDVGMFRVNEKDEKYSTALVSLVGYPAITLKNDLA